MRAVRYFPIAALALGATPLVAAPIAQVAELPADARVIDIRAEDACAHATLADARCLPAAWLFEADGGPIDFAALRWLLGTLGLDGDETVAVWPADAPNALATAALLHIAGQRAVVVYDGAAVPDDTGETRSFSREAVFTAPMRLDAVTIACTDAPLADRLAEYARGDSETVAIGPVSCTERM